MISERIEINENVTVGPQPSADEIRCLSHQGFESVINFRTNGEDEQPLSPDDEGQQVQIAGLEYVNIPVSMDSMNPELVDQFRSRFEALPKPIFAHCKSGKRAGAMVMMHMACVYGMTGEETLKKAEEMGFECDQPELVDFVKSYVNNHTQQEATAGAGQSS